MELDKGEDSKAKKLANIEVGFLTMHSNDQTELECYSTSTFLRLGVLHSLSAREGSEKSHPFSLSKKKINMQF